MRISQEVLGWDIYGMLGIRPDASNETIRRAHRQAAMRSHPDLNPAQSAAEDMARLNVAAGILLDPASRRAYDRARAARLEAARRQRPTRSQAPQARRSASTLDWASPHRRAPRGPLTAELKELLVRAHPQPSRALSDFYERLNDWPPRQQGLALAVMTILAVGLIAWARPASLAIGCGSDCPEQPVSAGHVARQ